MSISPRGLMAEAIQANKDVKDEFRRKYPKHHCLICQLLEEECMIKRLTIDHNHDTGMIRGWLCSLCNGRLGRLEHNAMLNPVQIEWTTRYKKEIEEHLQRDTGISYEVPNPQIPVWYRERLAYHLRLMKEVIGWMNNKDVVEIMKEAEWLNAAITNGNLVGADHKGNV